MWDIIVPLILIIIFYALPEVLKKKRRQENTNIRRFPTGCRRLCQTAFPPPVPAERRPEERPLPPPAPERVPVPEVVLPPMADERPRPAAAVRRQPEPHVRPVEPNYVPKEEPAPVLAAAAEARPWDGQLDQAAVVNGIIFAEIIQPPRCKRPFRHGFGRG
jgi:hypothetical protein